MLRTLLRDESNQFHVVEDPSAISDIVERRDRLLWLDLEKPTPADFATIQEEFSLHPLAIEDAMARHQRPKVDQYRTFYLVIFYSVAIETQQTLQPRDSSPSLVRRGLKGTDFYHPTGDPHPPGANGKSNPNKPSPWAVAELPPDPANLPNDGSGLPDVSSAPSPSGPAPDILGNERIVLREISLFMGENYLITVHDSPIPELDEAARRWRRNAETIVAEHESIHDVPGTRPLAPQDQPPPSPPPSSHLHNGGAKPKPDHTTPTGDAEHPDGIGILLYSLLDTIVDNYFPVIDNIVERVEDLEEQIFEKYNQRAIESIFTLKKDLLALRKVLAPERDVLNVLIRRDLPIFEEHTLVYFQDVYDHVVRITDSIDTYRDLLSSALDSFLSMQSNRLNITVQTLTSVSIILMSVAAVTGWYGMNFHDMPELSSPLGYPVIILSVAVVVLLEFLFFKRKGWL
jgi:Mg2+ and Co2+ transporter CorA